jgi:hypothetical protein
LIDKAHSQVLDIMELLEQKPELRDLCRHAVDKVHKGVSDVAALCKDSDEQVAVMVTCAWVLICYTLDLCIPSKITTHPIRMEVLETVLELLKSIVERVSRTREKDEKQ